MVAKTLKPARATTKKKQKTEKVNKKVPEKTKAKTLKSVTAKKPVAPKKTKTVESPKSARRPRKTSAVNVAPEVPPVVVKVPAKKNYLNNKDLLAEVIKSKSQKQMSNELAKMLVTLVNRYAKKGNFANYSYNDDMRGYATMMLVKTWNAFDPAKSNNPFAFFTQCVKNSFVQFLNQEKRQRDVKNEMLIDSGLNPSYSYALDHESETHHNHDPLSVDPSDQPASTFHENVDGDAEPVENYMQQ